MSEPASPAIQAGVPVGRLRASAAAITDRGRLRATNEDAFLLMLPLLAVADGLGGLAAGEVASRVVIDHLAASEPQPPAASDLVRLLRQAGRRVREAAAEDEARAGMATTCTAVVLADDAAEIAHVGDTRAYLLRERRLELLTRDHSLAQELVRLGRLSAGEAATHPSRHTLTRALGGPYDPEIDRSSQTLAAGDRLILCSDGLGASIDDGELVRLGAGDDAATAARRLLDAALAGGGIDNVTVIVVDLLQP